MSNGKDSIDREGGELYMVPAVYGSNGKDATEDTERPTDAEWKEIRFQADNYSEEQLFDDIEAHHFALASRHKDIDGNDVVEINRRFRMHISAPFELVLEGGRFILKRFS